MNLIYKKDRDKPFIFDCETVSVDKDFLRFITGTNIVRVKLSEIKWYHICSKNYIEEAGKWCKKFTVVKKESQQ